MQRVHSVDVQAAQGRAQELLGVVEKAFGVIPNAAKVMANSPVVLDSFLAFSTAMSQATIGEKLHTQVKLATSEANDCDYCTSLFCAVGPKAGLTADDLLAGRTAQAREPRTDAALKFSRAVLETRGKVSDNDLRLVRQAGFGDAEIVEVVASVVLGCFTNFLNNVADTTLDVPQAGALSCAAA